MSEKKVVLTPIHVHFDRETDDKPGDNVAVHQLKTKSYDEWNTELVGGLEHEVYDFPFSWEFHHPNWLSLHFSEG